MTAAHRDRIETAFASASDYDRHARVQHKVAQKLAAHIATLALPERPRILEIGCGTGFLTQALLDQGVDGDWLITDIAPPMLERCRERIGEAANRRFSVLDGEFGLPMEERFDLVCSSLVMQWFDDQAAALDRMLASLAPGGQCLFATLASETFAEWRAAHEQEGKQDGTLEFPGVQELARMAPQARVGEPMVERVVDHHVSALDFLRSLRAIGAKTASPGHRPIGPAAMRRIMRNFENAGSAVTYEVVTCHFIGGNTREQ